jgi:hypothetical protein
MMEEHRRSHLYVTLTATVTVMLLVVTGNGGPFRIIDPLARCQ